MGGGYYSTLAINMATTVALCDGTSIPNFGLGVYEAQLNGETRQACLWALQHGYRMIDTASIYR